MAARVDYSARDYGEIRRAVLERLGRSVPDWDPQNAADIGVTLVELLADAADRIAYAQDAIATEAYLGTARRTSSVRRHARLVGVFPDLGASARTWVSIDVDDDADVEIPAGTPVLTRLADTPTCVPADVAGTTIDRDHPTVFETLHSLRARGAHRTLRLHETEPRLEADSTSARLCGALLDLVPGSTLAFIDAMVDGPQFVRVVSVSVDDADRDSPVTEIEWHPGDRLRRAVGPSVRIIGNLVIAEHGRTVTLGPLEHHPGIGADGRFHASDLSCTTPVRDPTDTHSSAVDLLAPTGEFARPVVRLVDRAFPTRSWDAVRDLIGQHRFARAFIVEPDREGLFTVRFDRRADAGRPPVDRLDVVARLGSGPSGNVAAGAIAHVVGDFPGVRAVSNLVAGTGGRTAEPVTSLAARTPHSFRGCSTCVVPADYAALAREVDGVVDAVAVGSGFGDGGLVDIDVYVQSARGRAPRGLLRHVATTLDPRRTAGHLVTVHTAPVVEIELEVELVVDAGVDEADIIAETQRIVGDGPGGMFDPTRPQLGRPLAAPAVLTALARVRGVLEATMTSWRAAGVPATAARPDLQAVYRIEPFERIVTDVTVHLRGDPG